MANTKETSTNNQNKNFITDCNVTYAVQLVGGRWKLPILLQLQKEKKRFGELRKIISNITERMLTLQLRELEKDGLVSRTVYAEVPPRVEYELTTTGKELMPVCEELHKWGAKHRMAKNEALVSG
jgi:DNA-binding HxlR family transcriptional regulator